MPGPSKTTVYLQPHVCRARKAKAATTDRSISDLSNEAVREALREDAIDLEAFARRAKEPSQPLEKVLKDRKRDGLLPPPGPEPHREPDSAARKNPAPTSRPRPPRSAPALDEQFLRRWQLQRAGTRRGIVAAGA